MMGEGRIQIRCPCRVAQALPRHQPLLTQHMQRQPCVVGKLLTAAASFTRHDRHIAADAILLARCRQVPAQLSCTVAQKLRHLVRITKCQHALLAPHGADGRGQLTLLLRTSVANVRCSPSMKPLQCVTRGALRYTHMATGVPVGADT